MISPELLSAFLRGLWQRMPTKRESAAMGSVGLGLVGSFGLMTYFTTPVYELKHTQTEYLQNQRMLMVDLHHLEQFRHLNPKALDASIRMCDLLCHVPHMLKQTSRSPDYEDSLYTCRLWTRCSHSLHEFFQSTQKSKRISFTNSRRLRVTYARTYLQMQECYLKALQACRSLK